MQVVFALFVILSLYGPLFGEELDDLSLRDVTLSSESEPLATVAGCVNAVTGHYFQVETDLVGNTIDPLKIVRFYDSQSKLETSLGVGFGTQFPILASTSQKNARHSYALISEREGSYLTYRGKRTFEVDPRILKKGYTNTSAKEIGGKGNLVNWKARQNYKERFPWSVKMGDGTRRFYSQKITLPKSAKRRLRFRQSRPISSIMKSNPMAISSTMSTVLKTAPPFSPKLER